MHVHEAASYSSLERQPLKDRLLKEGVLWKSEPWHYGSLEDRSWPFITEKDKKKRKWEGRFWKLWYKIAREGSLLQYFSKQNYLFTFLLKNKHQPELLVKIICLFSPELELIQSFPFLVFDGPGESMKENKWNNESDSWLGRLHIIVAVTLPSAVSCWEVDSADLHFFDFWNNTSRSLVMYWKDIQFPTCIW